MPGRIRDTRKAEKLFVLQEVTVSRQRGYDVRIPRIAIITKGCGRTEKGALDFASERREKLTERGKFEFSDNDIPNRGNNIRKSIQG